MATYWENSCSFGLRYVSWYKCLVVGLVFSNLGFWSGGLFLTAPFPDLCLLVPFHVSYAGRLPFWDVLTTNIVYVPSDHCLLKTLCSWNYCLLYSIVPSRYLCYGSNCFVFWSRIFVLFGPYVRFHILVQFR